MYIGARIRALREERGMSQGDIENSTGLLRCYISRVENGHTVPSLETLERFAHALAIPLYQLFYVGAEMSATPYLAKQESLEEVAQEQSKAGEDARFLLTLKTLMTHLGDPDREVLLALAKKLASR